MQGMRSRARERIMTMKRARYAVGIGRMNTQSRTDGDATRALLAEGRGGDPTSFKLSER